MNTRPSELSFIASILTDPKCRKVLGQVEEQYFGDERLRMAFRVLREMWSKQEDISIITFEARWSEKVPDSDVSDIVEFVEGFKSSSHINTYVSCLRDGAVKRVTGDGLKELYDMIHKGEPNETILSKMDNLSKEVQLLAGTSQLPDRKKIMEQVTTQLVGQDAIEPIFTGLEPVDQNGGYLYDSMLIAARYGIGKTPYALRIINHNCIDKGRPGTIYSGENENKMIVMALMAMRTGIPIRSIKMGIWHLPEHEKKLLEEAQEEILDSPLYFCNWGRKDFYRLKSEFQHFKNKYNTEIHLIDAYPHINLNMSVYRKKTDALDDLADKIFQLKQDIPGLWLVLDQLRTKNVDDTPSLRDVMHSSKFEQNVDLGQIIDRKDKEKRRMDRERKQLSWKIKDIRNDPQKSEEQKAIDIYELQSNTILAGTAHIAQEKGRMGYGEWQAEVGFDDIAYGFYDKNSIRKNDPRRDELIRRLTVSADEQQEQDNNYDPEDF